MVDAITVQAGLGADDVVSAVAGAVGKQHDALAVALRGPLAAVRAIADATTAPAWMRYILGEVEALCAYWPEVDARRPGESFCEAVDAIFAAHDERASWRISTWGTGAGPAVRALCAAVVASAEADVPWSVTGEVVERLQEAVVEAATALQRDGETLGPGEPAWETIGELVRGAYGVHEEAARVAA